MDTNINGGIAKVVKFENDLAGREGGEKLMLQRFTGTVREFKTWLEIRLADASK